MSKYNPWPLGKLPEGFQRPEIDQLKEAGYEINDPRDAVTIFENKMLNTLVASMRSLSIVAQMPCFFV